LEAQAFEVQTFKHQTLHFSNLFS